jgi:hypothetical protein
MNHTATLYIILSILIKVEVSFSAEDALRYSSGIEFWWSSAVLGLR